MKRLLLSLLLVAQPLWAVQPSEILADPVIEARAREISEGLRCPVCHASNSLEAFTADEAGRELLVLLAQSGPLFRPLVGYLGCFRPASRDLSHQRALKLATEVLALGIDPARLAPALEETTAAMRQKRQEGAGKPLSNHNYLKRVVENTTTPAPAVTEYVTQASPPASTGTGAAAAKAPAHTAGTAPG